MHLRDVRFTYVNPGTRVYAVQRTLDPSKSPAAMNNRLFLSAPVWLQGGVENALLAYTSQERADAAAGALGAHVHPCMATEVQQLAQMLRMPVVVVVGEGAEGCVGTEEVYFVRRAVL